MRIGSEWFRLASSLPLLSKYNTILIETFWPEKEQPGTQPFVSRENITLHLIT